MSSQRSIASYFTAKPGTAAKPVAAAAAPASKPVPKRVKTEKAAKDDSSSQEHVSSDDEAPRSVRKRAHKSSQDLDAHQNGPTFPAAKKRRRSGQTELEVEKPKDSLAASQVIRDRFSFAPSSSPAIKEDNNPAVDQEPEDEAASKEKRRRHERFVKKLSKPDALGFEAMVRHQRGETSDQEDGEDMDEEEEEQPQAARKGSKAAPKRGNKLTPLEQQVVDIKLKHPDTLLVVEVGYKFRFFGEDARTASKELSIMCIPGRMKFTPDPAEANMTKFASASIPTHRLHVHVKRLVAAGHKVGVVRQLETAALKAAGDNRNAPFVRKLTNLYTKGTYIDDVDSAEDAAAGAGNAAPATGYLLCLTENPRGGTGADELVEFGLVAVQPSTGDIIYENFQDGFMRSEIETRLLHISPCEFLILGELSSATEKLVTHLAGSKSNVFRDRVRVERVDRPKKMHPAATAHVSEFYTQDSKNQETEEKKKLLEVVLNLPELVTCCVSAMITHLQSYGLEHVFDLTKYFESFSARSHMLLNGNTLSSLEIYRNQSDFSERGSLFWALNRTQTRYGRRLLRKWVGRPLLDRERLEERTGAVEELITSNNWRTEKLKSLLKSVRIDLEKSLIRIYYCKASRPETVSTLKAMRTIASTFPAVKEANEMGYKSDLLNGCLTLLPKIHADVEEFLQKVDHKAAENDDKYNFFIEEEDQYESITDHKMGITGVEMDLEEHLKEAALIVKKNKLSYVTVAGIDYLIEIENSKVKGVPNDWVKISGTKKVSRFHSPEVIKMLRERDQRKESLAAECDSQFKAFLSQIGTKYQELRDAVQSLATLDCLLSLAIVAAQPGYSKPTFTNDICIDVKKGRHPMVEQLLLDAYVPNDILMTADERRTMLVTGPNMGGKSSYVRQVALICIMGQIGSYVPAESAKLGLLDAVYTRMGAFDNMLKGESTFMVELSETNDIIKQATARSLIILDELGRGTSTHDGVAIAYAVLNHAVSEIKALTLFVTHYPILSQFADIYPKVVVNGHMAFEETGEPGSEDITFLYQIGEGVAHRSYGLNVAKLAKVPRSVLDTAAQKSRELEAELKGRELSRLISKISMDDDVGGDSEVLMQLSHLLGS